MLRRWLAWLGAEYGYTPPQVLQLLGLMLATLLLLGLPLAYKAWLLRQPPPPLPPIEVVAWADSAAAPSGNFGAERKADAPAMVILRPFDPNTADEATWQSLGAPAWLARRIGKYRAAGGIFRRAEDVGRIYDFPPELLARLAPYMRFAPAPPAATYRRDAERKGTYEPKAPAYPVLDLNTADSAQLEALPQLGPSTARNIIKYRKLLGGYVRPEQLYELYNQDSARTAVFLPYLRVTGQGLEPLRINEAARAGKLYHPYLPKAQARLITAWVRQHGNLARPEQLLQHRLTDSTAYKRLLPYLAF